MLKALVIPSISLTLCIFVSSSSFAQEVQIRPIDAPLRIEVSGHSKKSRWLGVTAIINGKEKDFKPRKVGGVTKRNSFSRTYKIDALDVAISGAFSRRASVEDADIEWIACLWDDKVSCEPHESKWCYKNGYEMRGRVTCDRY